MTHAEFRNHTMAISYDRFPNQNKTVVRCFSTNPENSMATEDMNRLCLSAPTESQIERVFTVHSEAVAFVDAKALRLGMVPNGEWIKAHA